MHVPQHASSSFGREKSAKDWKNAYAGSDRAVLLHVFIGIRWALLVGLCDFGRLVVYVSGCKLCLGDPRSRSWELALEVGLRVDPSDLEGIPWHAVDAHFMASADA